MSSEFVPLDSEPIELSKIDGQNVHSVLDISKKYEGKLTLQQMQFAEHYAVVRDEVESVRIAGLAEDYMGIADLKMMGQKMLSDKYIYEYIEDLRAFATADGLFATYNETIGFLVSVMNGTVRDVNGDLEFPKVSERVKASTKLLDILPESPQLNKLKADTEKVEISTKLDEEKLRMLKSGGMSEQESQVISVLKSINEIGTSE